MILCWKRIPFDRQLSGLFEFIVSNSFQQLLRFVTC